MSCNDVRITQVTYLQRLQRLAGVRALAGVVPRVQEQQVLDVLCQAVLQR